MLIDCISWEPLVGDSSFSASVRWWSYVTCIWAYLHYSASNCKRNQNLTFILYNITLHLLELWTIKQTATPPPPKPQWGLLPTSPCKMYFTWAHLNCQAVDNLGEEFRWRGFSEAYEICCSVPRKHPQVLILTPPQALGENLACISVSHRGSSGRSHGYFHTDPPLLLLQFLALFSPATIIWAPTTFTTLDTSIMEMHEDMTISLEWSEERMRV